MADLSGNFRSNTNKKPGDHGHVSRPTFLTAMIVTMVLSFVIGARSDQIIMAVAPWFGARADSGSLDLASVQQAYQRLRQKYDGDLDVDALINGASRGMIAAAGDPYTVYMDKSEAEEFARELSGEIGGGVGAEIGVRSGQPTIVRVLPGNPAERAGVRAGDVITAVNNESTRSYTAEQAAKLVRGREGTSVKLVVRRGEEAREFNIARATINNPSVTSSADQGIGVIKISRFDQQTGELARQAAQSLRQQNVRGVVLDLRDNGGGYVDAAQAVAGLWLPSSEVVVTEKSATRVIDTLRATGDPLMRGMPTVVLVNSSSASASEIVAGALHDHGAATLVGEKTFGKGSVQEQVKLDGGALLKVTIARWYTPKGVNITSDGINPDQVVNMSAADIDAGRDPQMDTARARL